MTDDFMQALFIGQTYIDVTFITDHMPTGDEKHVASAYAVSFGGNAVTAAFCCAKLGIVPDLIATVANDWLGRMFQDMSAKYGISIHPRKVDSSSLSFIMPKDGKRAIVRCRDDAYLNAFALLDLAGCRVLHVDGHQPYRRRPVGGTWAALVRRDRHGSLARRPPGAATAHPRYQRRRGRVSRRL